MLDRWNVRSSDSIIQQSKFLIAKSFKIIAEGSFLIDKQKALYIRIDGGVGSGGVLFFRLLLKNTELRPH